MKKLFVIAVVTIASASAFASKARLAALQSAAHVSDAQDVVGDNGGPIKPDQALGNGEWVSLEWGGNRGATNAAVTKNAEGGFVRKMGDNAAMGAYLGNKSDSYSLFMALAAGTGAVAGTGTGTTALLNQSNPLNLYYAAKAGDMQWGLGLFYVSNDVKASKMKENIMSLTASATAAAGWDAQLTVGLGAESKNEQTAGSEKVLKGGSSMALSGGYKMDTMYVYGAYKTLAAKLTTGASTTNADWDINIMQVGVVNSHKKDGADFFYGVSYNTDTRKEKQGNTKSEETTFPVIIGVEAEATSWMVLRGSVTQNVLLGSTKAAGATDANTIADNTTVAAGAGLKFGKFMLDGTFTNAASGTATGLGTDANFVTNVGMTYNF
ncbi:MAG: hypothetical protein AABY64_00880 [Bdellovibrionota bacterium]